MRGPFTDEPTTDFGLETHRRRMRRAIADVEAELGHRVGNLCLIRKCTDAMMGVHPFGGMKMSGTNTTSGGPDHLANVMEAKAVGERLC